MCIFIYMGISLGVHTGQHMKPDYNPGIWSDEVNTVLQLYSVGVRELIISKEKFQMSLGPHGIKGKCRAFVFLYRWIHKITESGNVCWLCIWISKECEQFVNLSHLNERWYFKQLLRWVNNVSRRLESNLWLIFYFLLWANTMILSCLQVYQIM